MYFIFFINIFGVLGIAMGSIFSMVGGVRYFKAKDLVSKHRAWMLVLLGCILIILGFVAIFAASFINSAPF